MHNKLLPTLMQGYYFKTLFVDQLTGCPARSAMLVYWTSPSSQTVHSLRNGCGEKPGSNVYIQADDARHEVKDSSKSIVPGNY